jgi:hypothetical protein
MRRITASEKIAQLEKRVAQLEKESFDLKQIPDWLFGKVDSKMEDLHTQLNYNFKNLFGNKVKITYPVKKEIKNPFNVSKAMYTGKLIVGREHINYTVRVLNNSKIELAGLNPFSPEQFYKSSNFAFYISKDKVVSSRDITSVASLEAIVDAVEAKYPHILGTDI